MRHLPTTWLTYIVCLLALFAAAGGAYWGVRDAVPMLRTPRGVMTEAEEKRWRCYNLVQRCYEYEAGTTSINICVKHAKDSVFCEDIPIK